MPAPRPRSPRSLSGLLPFLQPYRGRIALALLFLVLAALSTLAFPLALKSLIDQGLVSSDPGERVMALREHFLALFARGRGAGRVLGGALLHGQLARRTHHRRPAQRRLCACGRAKPGILRKHADRRGAEPADHRHHAGADGGRLEPEHGAAQHRHGPGRAGHAGDHQPVGDDAGAGHPGAGGAAQPVLRPPRAPPVAAPARTAWPIPAPSPPRC